MLYGGGLLLAVELCLVVYCVIDVITTPDTAVRNLPKIAWLALVLLFPLVGGVAWLVAGRPQRAARSLPYKGNHGVPAEDDRPGRATAHSPDDDEAFLRGLQQRADEQRRRAEQQRRAREADEG